MRETPGLRLPLPSCFSDDPRFGSPKGQTTAPDHPLDHRAVIASVQDRLRVAIGGGTRDRLLPGRHVAKSYPSSGGGPGWTGGHHPAWRPVLLVDAVSCIISYQDAEGGVAASGAGVLGGPWNRGRGWRRTKGVRTRAVTVAVFLALALAVGCGGQDDEGGGDAGEAADAMDPAPAAGGGEGGEAEAGTGSAVAATLAQVAQAQDDREIIRTATLEVGTEDVAGASDVAVRVATEAGGFLASSESDLQGDTRASLVLRVPPDRFFDVLDDLADLGELESRQVGSEDVTAQVVDLEGRLAAVRASVERLRALVAQAADVPQIVAIEGELARREGELESLTGQLRVLGEQVDLATVTLVLDEPATAEVSDDIPGFVPGLRTGVVALANVASVAVTALGFLLPFTVPAVLVWFGARWVRRVLRRRRAPLPVMAAGRADAGRAPAPPPPSA